MDVTFTLITTPSVACEVCVKNLFSAHIMGKLDNARAFRYH